ncbi:MAG TPA: DMT family transporter, partial [Spirochaetia bacterium]|nr:DMT family transporter [Spirochaetia bacterium]
IQGSQEEACCQRLRPECALRPTLRRVTLHHIMQEKPERHLASVLLALFVTVLWASSWIIIKKNITAIPPLQFAGLRYGLAALVLFPFALARGEFRQALRLPRRELLRLIALGVIYYSLTQGAMFISLSVIPATELSLILSFTTVIVAFGGMWLLREKPRPAQWLGTLVFLTGATLFLIPFHLAGGLSALLVALLTLGANSASSLLARSVNRTQLLSPLGVTSVTIGVGGALLLLTGTIVDGFPHLAARHWLIIFWLAVVNTTLAFTLWNRALVVISALESSVINNTMLFQIALLAWIFLGESLVQYPLFGRAKPAPVDDAA